MDNFSRAGDRLVFGAVSGMGAVVAAISRESLNQCPIEFGTLRRSYRVDRPSRDEAGAWKISFGYGYGGEIEPLRKLPASGYAVPVHERVEVRHAPPTKAKFLEDPVLAYAPVLEIVMKQAMENSLGPVYATARLDPSIIIVVEPEIGAADFVGPVASPAEGAFTNIPAFGGGFMVRGPGGRFVGVTGR